MDNKVSYLIRFNEGKFKGKTKQIAAKISEIESDGLAAYLIDEGFLDHYVNGKSYFEIVSRFVM